jgi:hypothetical protein
MTEVVFRVMTWEHIPIDEAKQKKADAKAQEEYDADEDNFETEYDEPMVPSRVLQNIPKLIFLRLSTIV